MKRLAAMTQVLLVDEDVELGEMLTEYLEREGFGATAVADGEAGGRVRRRGAGRDDAAPERHRSLAPLFW